MNKGDNHKILLDGVGKEIVLESSIEKKTKIRKLPHYKGVKLSSTLSGQRELIREMRNKINKIIYYINNHD